MSIFFRSLFLLHREIQVAIANISFVARRSLRALICYQRFPLTTHLPLKSKSNVHSLIGIVASLFLLSRPILDIAQFFELLSIQWDPLLLAKIGAVISIIALFSGASLGSFLPEKKMRIIGVHVTLMLFGVLFHIPLLAEILGAVANTLSYVGCVLLIAGWFVGRRIF